MNLQQGVHKRGSLDLGLSFFFFNPVNRAWATANPATWQQQLQQYITADIWCQASQVSTHNRYNWDKISVISIKKYTSEYGGSQLNTLHAP